MVHLPPPDLFRQHDRNPLSLSLNSLALRQDFRFSLRFWLPLRMRRYRPWIQLFDFCLADVRTRPSVSTIRLSAAESYSLFSTAKFLPKSRVHWNLFSGRIFKPSVKGLCSQPSLEEDFSKCWSCGAFFSSRPSLVCDSCRCVQPVNRSVDFFQILGVEKKYDIEEGGLEGKYKEWQRKLHPDLVHSKSQRERDYAAEQSARVIDAYRTVKNPLSRAIYLMKLQGILVDEEQTVYEPDLLAEIMEIREAVEESSDSQTLKQIQSQVLEKLQHWSRCFGSAYGSQDNEEALNSIRRMTYYKRVNEEIEKKL